MKPDAEHQQNHAEFSQLGDGMRIFCETRRERADGKTRKQVPDNGGQADTTRGQSANE